MAAQRQYGTADASLRMFYQSQPARDGWALRGGCARDPLSGSRCNASTTWNAFRHQPGQCFAGAEDRAPGKARRNRRTAAAAAAASRVLLLSALVPIVGSCTVQETATPDNPALSARIEQLVETFLTSDDDAKNTSVLSEARLIFEQEGIPSRAKVGDAAAYGFVLINMLGQPPDFRLQFFARVEEASSGLSQDALAFAEARRRLTEVEKRYRAHTPSHPDLRDQISQLLKDDQAVREREGFDLRKMEEADRRTAGPLKAIFDRYGVPTYDMVGVQAAKDFVVMVQHQPREFRLAVLPKLKAIVDAGQADPGVYAMVYDRTQRDQGKNQLYGQALECTAGKELDVAPIDDATNVNVRRAELGLMRLELYARLVRLNSPDLCGSAGSKK